MIKILLMLMTVDGKFGKKKIFLFFDSTLEAKVLLDPIFYDFSLS